MLNWLFLGLLRYEQHLAGVGSGVSTPSREHHRSSAGSTMAVRILSSIPRHKILIEVVRRNLATISSNVYSKKRRSRWLGTQFTHRVPQPLLTIHIDPQINVLSPPHSNNYNLLEKRRKRRTRRPRVSLNIPSHPSTLQPPPPPPPSSRSRRVHSFLPTKS